MDELLVSPSKQSVESCVIVSKSGSKEVNMKIASFFYANGLLRQGIRLAASGWTGPSPQRRGAEAPRRRVAHFGARCEARVAAPRLGQPCSESFQTCRHRRLSVKRRRLVRQAKRRCGPEQRWDAASASGPPPPSAFHPKVPPGLHDEKTTRG